ncbi:phage head closure protein [Pelagibacterium sp.]|uniref:phage head closure protein n=1 Tax=Pelagibacterium sp. TaxID=1967288 RepID=UPI003A904341
MSLRPDNTRERVTAGKRDRRITLKKAGTPDLDGAGNPIPGSGDPVSIVRWAEYMPVSDSERIAAMEVSAEYTARFRILWSDAVEDLNPTWWLEYSGKVYDVSAVKEQGRRDGLEITASARAE